jgi:hypothetical protein
VGAQSPPTHLIAFSAQNAPAARALTKNAAIYCAMSSRGGVVAQSPHRACGRKAPQGLLAQGPHPDPLSPMLLDAPCAGLAPPPK